MKFASNRDVLLFAGQGSNSHWKAPEAATTARQLLQPKHAQIFDLLLSTCRDAFTSELESATAEERSIFPKMLENPECLLFPPSENHSHPLLETVSLYMHQILELILYESQPNGKRCVAEVAGICTGILPAILAASFGSFDSVAFITTAVEGFRVAFWIGMRASIYARSIERDNWQRTSCLLTVFGSNTQKVQEVLDACVNDHDKSTLPKPRISAILADNSLSVSGPGSVLNNVKSTLNSAGIKCLWAHVHAIYHGGCDMEDILQQTMANIQRRHIVFPTWESLQTPLRITTDGTCVFFDTQGKKGSTLLETALRGIFVDTVQWQDTARALVSSRLQSLNGGDKVHLIGLGPGSRTLFHFLSSLQLQSSVQSHITTTESWVEYLAKPSDDDIAIVGLSVNYPEAENQEDFWELIVNKKNTVCEIPSSRFDLSKCNGGKPSQPSENQNQKDPRFGNFLDNTFDFDAGFFNISPREAKSMDPQQRLILHEAHRALQDAGYSPDSTSSFQRDTFGVYTGVATGDYVDNLREDIDVYYSPGTLRAFLSGRISYAFKFHGPSMVIDTACSSSLVALHSACMALQRNDCTAALAIGVNTISSPDMFRGLKRAHFLSPTGQCKPFDEEADGYCRAEGAGAVVVKKLSYAAKEGDHIYGVIRGICINQCGTAKSITHPHAGTQEALFKQVLNISRVTPESISVVEAHGTGTQAGDFAEVSSLKAVFDSSAFTSRRSSPLYLSSVKGNLGHAEAASGIAGLAKLLLMMEKQAIPPQASHNKANPRLKLQESRRLHVPTQLQEWSLEPFQPARRALLNNFGASGSNVALILEEYQPPVAETKLESITHHTFTLSGKNLNTLDSLRSDYIEKLSGSFNATIQDVCYTANARTQPLSPFKLAVVADDTAGLVRRLQNVTDAERRCSSAEKLPKVVFSFSGQGDMRPAVGAELLASNSTFCAVVKDCDALLCANGFRPVSPFLKGSSEGDESEDIVVSQCACFVLQLALANMWIAWGISPNLVVGHSIGEYAAFSVSGVLNWKDALLFVSNRANSMVSKCAGSSSGMLACRMTADAADKLLQETDTTITCYNSVQDIVIGGETVSLHKLISQLKDKGVKHKLLQVPYAFHSSAMDPMLGELRSHAAGLKMRQMAVQTGSSLEGKILDSETTLATDYFVRHAREPVLFSSLVSDVARWSANTEITVIEIGPSGSMETMFKSGLSQHQHHYLASLKPTRPSWSTLATGLQYLFLRGYALNWRAVYLGTEAQFLKTLPKYPMVKSRFFTPFLHSDTKTLKLHDENDQSVKLGQALLSRAPISMDTAANASFKTSMMQISRFIQAHVVGGTSLCPGSVYLEIVLEAMDFHVGTTNTKTDIFTFGNVSFEHPLTLNSHSDASENIYMLTELRHCEAPIKGRDFRCKSANQTHCSGHVQNLELPAADSLNIFRRKKLAVERLSRSVLYSVSNKTSQTFSSPTIYNIIFPRVVAYSEPYLTLKHLTLSDTGLEAHGSFQLTDLTSGYNGTFIASPALVDTLLHTAGFLANFRVAQDTACICASIEQALIVKNVAGLYSDELQVFCSVGDIGSAYMADAYAVASDGNIIAYVEGMCFKKLKLRSFQAFLAHKSSLEPGTKHGLAKMATKTAAQVVSQDKQLRADAKPSNTLSSKISVADCVSDIIRDTCALKNKPSPLSTLDELGIDSLLSIDLEDLLQKHFSHIDGFSIDIESCRTVQDVVSAVEEFDSRGNMSSDDSLRQHTATSSSATNSVADTAMSSVIETTQPQPASIKSIFMNVCGLDPTNQKDTCLSFLGIDSLMAIELLEELRCKLGINVDQDLGDISEMTYQQLEDACMLDISALQSTSCSSEASDDAFHAHSNQVDALEIAETQGTTALATPAETPTQCTKHLWQYAGSNPSLFMFHDGSGLCNMYSRLVGLHRDLHGIYSLESASSIPADSGTNTMEELSMFYIEQARLTDREGLILGGWSFGGVLAFEVSRQLRRLGIHVKGVILIDSPVPKDHKALPQEVVSFILSNEPKPANSGAGISAAAQLARARVAAQFERHAMMLQHYQPAAEKIAATCVMIKCLENIDTLQAYGVEYPFLSSSEARDESIREWEALTGRQIPVLDLHCNHFEIFNTSHLAEISEKLEQACSIIDMAA